MTEVAMENTFLGPVQYDRSCHGKHSKLLNMEKHSMFSAMLSAMQSEWNNFLAANHITLCTPHTPTVCQGMCSCKISKLHVY